MGRRRVAEEMFIYMNGQKVGRLLRNAAGKLEMTYAEEWLRSEDRRPLSLSLPLSSQIHSGEALNVPLALKYESDGGPSIARIMELLFGSSEGLADRERSWPCRFSFGFSVPSTATRKTSAFFYFRGEASGSPPPMTSCLPTPSLPNGNWTRPISGWRWPSGGRPGIMTGPESCIATGWEQLKPAAFPQKRWRPSSATFWIGWTK